MFSRCGYFNDYTSNVFARLLLAVNVTFLYIVFAGSAIYFMGVYIPAKYSTFVLLFLNAASAAADLMCMRKCARTPAGAIASYLLPLEIYTVLVYGRIWSVMTIVLAIVSAAAFIILLAFTAKPLIQKLRKRPAKVVARFTGRLLAFTLALCFSVMIGRVLYETFAPRKTASPSADYSVEIGNEDGWHIRNNIDTLVKLSDDSWDSMSAEDKLNVLQVVLNIEVEYLGIPYELMLAASEMPSSEAALLAQYTHSDHAILINLDYLETLTSYECVEGACHEAFHCLQHCAVEAYQDMDDNYKGLYYFYYIETMNNEFENYIDGKADIEGYASQYVERSARAYGAWAAQDYKETIEEYIQNGYRFVDNGE